MSKLFIITLLAMASMIHIARGQTGNHVFQGAEAASHNTVLDLSTPGGQTWSTFRGAAPGYWSAISSAAYTGAADGTANVDGYVKYYALNAPAASFVYPLGQGGDLRTLTIAGTIPATAEFGSAWIVGDPSGNMDPTSTGASAGPHNITSVGPGIQAVSRVGQWDWQDLSSNANGVTVRASIPDVAALTTQATRLRLVGWNGTRWINLSATQGTAAGTGIAENSSLTGTMQAGITAIGIGVAALPPVATNDGSTGNTPGTDVTTNILANDTLSDGSVATTTRTTVALTTTGLPAGSIVSGNTVTVPGQGTWTYDPATGNLTFDPETGFTGNPTPLSYILTETATGLTDNATVTVTFDGSIVFDYGDLPYSGAAVNYPKVKAAFKDTDNDHVPDDAAAVWLGQIIDSEADGFTNPAIPADFAKGDDKSGVPDEDGLKVNGGMAPGTVTWTITANSNQPATVHYGLWLDWGTPTAAPDGTFDNFYSGTITTASPAGQSVSVTVPATFLTGSVVNVRLMASPTALDQATGFRTDLANGEVEDFQFSFEQAMPVRLVSFDATASETNADLNWKAADQENFDRYEVERSVDGKQFTKIGQVDWNSEKTGKYTYTDRAAANYGRQLYYRLKMVDTDNTFAYSTIRPVRFETAMNSNVYPNPAIDKLTVKVPDWTQVKSIRIDNLAGMQVFTSGPVESGVIDVTGLNAGMHILRITYKDGTMQMHKFVHIR